jgi:hypothetical protein
MAYAEIWPHVRATSSVYGRTITPSSQWFRASEQGLKLAE